jgi:hypothetical protein
MIFNLIPTKWTINRLVGLLLHIFYNLLLSRGNLSKKEQERLAVLEQNDLPGMESSYDYLSAPRSSLGQDKKGTDAGKA